MTARTPTRSWPRHWSMLLRYRLGVAAMLIICWAGEVAAQPFFFGNERARRTTSVTVGYTWLDFEFNGNIAPSRPLNYSDAALQVLFSRANFMGSLVYGLQSADNPDAFDLRTVDFSLYAWGEVFFSSDATSADHQFFAPITLYSNFREVSPRGLNALEEFSITTLGIGLGLGYYGHVSDQALIELRATPIVGLALQSFGESTGWTRLLDAHAQVHLGRVFNRIGISFGYRFRASIWDVRVSDVFFVSETDLFDYKETMHGFHVGVNW